MNRFLDYLFRRWKSIDDIPDTPTPNETWFHINDALNRITAFKIPEATSDFQAHIADVKLVLAEAKEKKAKKLARMEELRLDILEVDSVIRSMEYTLDIYTNTNRMTKRTKGTANDTDIDTLFEDALESSGLDEEVRMAAG